MNLLIARTVDILVTILLVIEWARWRRRAIKAEIRAAYLTAICKYLSALTQIGGLIEAMLNGQRLVVTVAPEGLTLEEAQLAVDNIYDSLRGQRSN